MPLPNACDASVSFAVLSPTSSEKKNLKQNVWPRPTVATSVGVPILPAIRMF